MDPISLTLPRHQHQTDQIPILHEPQIKNLRTPSRTTPLVHLRQRNCLQKNQNDPQKMHIRIKTQSTTTLGLQLQHRSVLQRSLRLNSQLQKTNHPPQRIPRSHARNPIHIQIEYRFRGKLPNKWTGYKERIKRYYPLLYDNKYLFNTSPMLSSLAVGKQTSLESCFLGMRRYEDNIKEQKGNQQLPVTIEIDPDFH